MAKGNRPRKGRGPSRKTTKPVKPSKLSPEMIKDIERSLRASLKEMERKRTEKLGMQRIMAIDLAAAEYRLVRLAPTKEEREKRLTTAMLHLAIGNNARKRMGLPRLTIRDAVKLSEWWSAAERRRAQDKIIQIKLEQKRPSKRK